MTALYSLSRGYIMVRTSTVIFLLLINFFVFGRDETPFSPLTRNEYPAEFYQGLLHQLNSADPDKAISFLEEEIESHEKRNHPSVVVNLHIINGILQRKLSSARGFVELQKALSKAAGAGLAYEQALAYLELGYTAQGEGQKEIALENFLEGIKVSEAYHLSDLAFRIYFSAGHLQYASDNFQEAIFMLEKGLRFNSFEQWAEKEKGVSHSVMKCYNTLGLSYMLLGDYGPCLSSYKKALQMASWLEDEFWIGLIQGNMGTLYLKKSDCDSALVLLKMDLTVSKKFNSRTSIASTYITLAELHENKRELETASLFYDSAGHIIDELKIPWPSYYIKRAELSYRMNHYKDAIEYGFTYKAQNDSLAQIKKSKALALLQAGFDFENKLGELYSLEKENQLKDEELNYKNLVIIASAVILLVSIALIIVLLRSNRLKVRMNETLEKEVDRRTRKLAYTVKELDTVVYRLSHDFRRPLTTLIGLDHLGRSLTQNQETQEIFEKIGKTARQMDKMLYKMTFVHEINSQKPKFQLINLKQLVNDVACTFESELKRCDLNFKEEIDPTLEVNTDPAFLRIVVSNLLENALVYSADHQNACIRISAGETGDTWYMDVEDNGSGISESIMPRIYEPFFRGSSVSEGNGLGLYLVKRATRRLKGRVDVMSSPKGGSRFTVQFPQ